jgi:hypothetical protein
LLVPNWAAICAPAAFTAALCALPPPPATYVVTVNVGRAPPLWATTTLIAPSA